MSIHGSIMDNIVLLSAPCIRASVARKLTPERMLRGVDSRHVMICFRKPLKVLISSLNQGWVWVDK